QPLSGYVDIVFAAFTLGAFAFALLAIENGRTSDVAFCALSSGLAMGVKISFIYFSGPVILLLLASAAWRGVGAGSVVRIAGRLALIGLLFVAGCGYWLGRNLIQTGNPIFPSSVKIAGRTLLEGPSEIVGSKRQQGWFVPDTASWARYPF